MFNAYVFSTVDAPGQHKISLLPLKKNVDANLMGIKASVKIRYVLIPNLIKPSAAKIFCYKYHLIRIINQEKTQALGFAHKYEDNLDFNILRHQLLSLEFLSPREVKTTWTV